MVILKLLSSVVLLACERIFPIFPSDSYTAHASLAVRSIVLWLVRGRKKSDWTASVMCI